MSLILGQVNKPSARTQFKHTISLPQNLCVVLLNATRDDDMSNESPRNIALALGCTFVSISNKTFTVNNKCVDWATRGVTMPIEDEVIAKYTNWLKYNRSEVEIDTEQIGVEI